MYAISGILKINKITIMTVYYSIIITKYSFYIAACGSHGTIPVIPLLPSFDRLIEVRSYNN
jgi:hypothetical protein